MSARDLRDLRSFLKVASYEAKRPSNSELKVGVFPFVTISRAFGAGGRRLARALIELMAEERDPLFSGWRIFDREECEKLVEVPELRNSLRSVLSEEYCSEIEGLILNLLGQSSAQSPIINEIFSAIRTLATVGKVIIVGRAGCCVTASLQRGVHLRLQAPEAYRIRLLQESYEMSEAALRRLIRQRDRDRARLMQSFFHKDINDNSLYDAIWNTSRVPIRTIGKATLALIRSKAQVSAEPAKDERPSLREGVLDYRI